MDVSIIIVNYHTERLIADCVASIVAMTEGVSYEVIVVDNASNPDYKEVIEERVAGVCRYIDLKENIGFGRANNEGFKLARGRNLFCLNPDTLLLNNAVKELSDYLDAHPDCGACGANLYDARMRPSHSFVRFLPGYKWELNELLHLLPEKLAYGKSRRFNYTDVPLDLKGYVSGAAFMVKRDVVNQTGGFSDDFFLYYEETDLCRRILKAGWKISNVPSAKVQHLEGGDGRNRNFNPARIQHVENGRHVYYTKNFSNLKQNVLNIIYLAFLATRCLLKCDKAYALRLHIVMKSDKKLSR